MPFVIRYIHNKIIIFKLVSDPFGPHNWQAGLAGINLGKFLIKRVIELVKKDMPHVSVSFDFLWWKYWQLDSYLKDRHYEMHIKYPPTKYFMLGLYSWLTGPWLDCSIWQHLVLEFQCHFIFDRPGFSCQVFPVEHLHPRQLVLLFLLQFPKTGRYIWSKSAQETELLSGDVDLNQLIINFRRWERNWGDDLLVFAVLFTLAGILCYVSYVLM